MLLEGGQKGTSLHLDDIAQVLKLPKIFPLQGPRVWLCVAGKQIVMLQLSCNSVLHLRIGCNGIQHPSD